MCERDKANATLTACIRQAHQASDETYGMPRIRAELADAGVVASRKRIARLMRINQLGVADMTYIPTWAGFLYLAVVTDVYSRKVVGWAFGETMTAQLVISALNMALLTRKPESVIHHSDQGSQYTSIAFGNRCKEMGVRPSMGTVGDAYDNAMAESFFASLECELIARRTWRTKTEARLAIFTWIETWYNPRRRHSGLGQMSPINFEMKEQEKPVQNSEITPITITLDLIPERD